MGIGVTSVIFALFAWLGTSLETPICSTEDRRYMESYSIDIKECKEYHARNKT